MNILIYILGGVIVGIIISYFLWQKGKETAVQDIGTGIITDQMKEKEANLQKIREYITGKDKITNEEIQKLLNISNATTARYFNELEQEGLIKQVGDTGQGVYYKIIK